MEDVTGRNPGEEGLQGLEALPDEGLLDIARILDCLVHHKLAELVDDLELIVESLLHVCGLLLEQCVLAEIEYFLREQPQNVQYVLTLVLALVSRLA